MADKLDTYQRKRRFAETPEPAGVQRRTRRRAHALSYVIQEHNARQHHYDFRLELNGTLKSWAIPKGPSLDPSVKRLAVHVEDHPLEYGSFEGEIPEGNYGAGTVIIWDRGTWEPAGGQAQADEAYRAGKLKFTLHGEKLHGGWMLVKSRMRDGDKEQWLLVKERDDEAKSADEYDVLAKQPGSVLGGGEGTKGTKSAQGTQRRAGANAPAALRGAAHHTAAARTAAGKRAGASKSKQTDIVTTRSAQSLRTLAADPAIEGAVKAYLPATFKPQLATLVDAAPAGADWSYEIKFDGYRVLIRIDRQDKQPVRIFTRAGNDWTAKFAQKAKALDALDIASGWLDGEAVVLDERGVPSFQALQNAFDANRPQDIVFYLFDVPFLNGYDLRAVPLVQRRALLAALMELSDDPALRFSQDFGFAADDLLKSACDMALEGIIGKRRDSAYTPGRSAAWIKLKCRRRQEFVIGGYTEPSGSRAAFGALLLGVYDAKGKLQYAGRVGTGFDAATLRAIKEELDRRETSRMPFANAPAERSAARVHWVKPELVAECNFAEWTKESIVRQASFVSLRSDKPARQIVRETPREGTEVDGDTDDEGSAAAGKSPGKPRAAGKAANKAATAAGQPGASKASARTEAGAPSVAGVRVTHPERVIDKTTGIRKIDVVHYYEQMAERMLPHLKDRPVALVRVPEEIGGEQFFQKHSQKLSIPNVTQHPGLDPGHPALITIDSAAALIGAAQMGTIELHTWNALVTRIETPDRVVFDLDPDPSLGWDKMIEAAQLTRALLDELGLASFCKTSGGKGLHVVVPLSGETGWDDVKAFAQAVANHMAATLPTHFSAKMGPQNRKQKIFVDYLRNSRGASTVAPFSLRARPGLGVSVPLAWDEVADTTAGDQWTIANVRERLDAQKRDPWAAYPKTRQRITAALMKRLAKGA
jgi:bifunctional non-homologous end joining protein LigD